MGAYCSVAQLTARFASTVEAAYVTDNEAAGVISSTVAAECIGSAEGLENSYIGVRYRLPFTAAELTNTTLAELLLGMTLDIAEYNVLNRGPRIGPEKIAQYERWIEWLKMLAEGQVVLPGAEEIPSSTGTPEASWSTWDRIYADDDVRDVTRSTAGWL